MMRFFLTLALSVLAMLSLAAVAQAECPMLVADRFTVRFVTDDGFEIKDTDGTITRVPVDAPHAACVSLRLAPAHDNGAVLVEAIYQTGDMGTNVLIDEKNFVVLSLKDKKLATEPVTLSERHGRDHRTTNFEMNTVAWKKNGASFILEKNDVDGHEVTQIWPPLTPLPTPLPTSGASDAPAATSAKKRPPGTDSIN